MQVKQLSMASSASTQFVTLSTVSLRCMENSSVIYQRKNVKAALLVIDSPGGLVTDSHQIYHRLQKLRQVKPVYVQMKRMAASPTATL